MVLVTSAIGFILASRDAGVPVDGVRLLLTLAGIGMAAAGAACLNNYMERDLDALMLRTQQRALPSGAVEPAHALAYGLTMVLGGVFLLASRINLMAAFVVLLTAFLYVLVYTPLKRWTWWNTSLGAIPGALPPVSGWVAVSHEMEVGAWIMFAILFLWQHPHFYAIAWMYRDDYARAGYKMLSVVNPDGTRLFRHIVFHAALLLIAGVGPAMIGMAGWWYGAGAFLLGIMVMEVGLRLQHSQSVADARKLLRASVYYLPALLALILLDVWV